MESRDVIHQSTMSYGLDEDLVENAIWLVRCALSFSSFYEDAALHRERL